MQDEDVKGCKMGKTPAHEECGMYLVFSLVVCSWEGDGLVVACKVAQVLQLGFFPPVCMVACCCRLVVEGEQDEDVKGCKMGTPPAHEECGMYLGFSLVAYNWEGDGLMEKHKEIEEHEEGEEECGHRKEIEID